MQTISQLGTEAFEFVCGDGCNYYSLVTDDVIHLNTSWRQGHYRCVCFRRKLDAIFCGCRSAVEIVFEAELLWPWNCGSMLRRDITGIHQWGDERNEKLDNVSQKGCGTLDSTVPCLSDFRGIILEEATSAMMKKNKMCRSSKRADAACLFVCLSVQFSFVFFNDSIYPDLLRRIKFYLGHRRTLLCPRTDSM